MQNLEHDIDSFLKEQSETTEQKEIIDTEKPLIPENINNDDFDEELEKKQKSDKQIKKVADKVLEHLPINARKEAANYALMIDMTQSVLFTQLHKTKAVKKLGGKDKWNKAVNINEDVEAGVLTKKNLTPEELKQYNIVQRTLTKIEGLRLTKEEKELWIDALKGFVAENGYKMPPHVLLIIAAINTIAPRAASLMVD